MFNKYKLSQIWRVITWKTPSTKNADYFSSNKDKYLFVTPRDMNNNAKHINHTERYLTNLVEKSFKNLIIDDKSICVSCIGTVWKVFIPSEKSVTNQQINSITEIKSFCNVDYLYYYLILHSKEIEALAGGTTMPIVNKTSFENFEVYLPDITEQDKVAYILNILDEKIELNNQINHNLHNIAEEKYNIVSKTGNVRDLDDLLTNIATGSRPKWGAQEIGIPSIWAEKIEKFWIYDYSSEKYISEEYYNKIKNWILRSGDVLLYKDWAYTGKVSMSLNGFPHWKAAVNEHVYILNTEKNRAQNYLYFTLYNKENRDMIHKIASSKAAQPWLNQVELRNLEIKIWSKDDIMKFENFVKPIMEKIALNALENKKLSNLRDTLLPKLMNWEINLDNVTI